VECLPRSAILGCVPIFLPLCTMAMGRLGILSRVAGFLFGSDMAYAVSQESSAPGQVPIADARAISDGPLKYAR